MEKDTANIFVMWCLTTYWMSKTNPRYNNNVSPDSKVFCAIGAHITLEQTKTFSISENSQMCDACRPCKNIGFWGCLERKFSHHNQRAIQSYNTLTKWEIIRITPKPASTFKSSKYTSGIKLSTRADLYAPTQENTKHTHEIKREETLAQLWLKIGSNFSLLTREKSSSFVLNFVVWTPFARNGRVCWWFVEDGPRSTFRPDGSRFCGFHGQGPRSGHQRQPDRQLPTQWQEGGVNQARSVVLPLDMALSDPDSAMSATRQKVTSLEAALNVLVGHSGPKVDVLKAALQKAKEAARERPLTEQLAFTESFIERSRKRIEVLETKKAEEVALLEQVSQWQNRLRQEILAQASEPPVVGSGPESCSEVVALRARVAELEACASRPPRNLEDAAQNIRAKAAKRRLGTCSEDVVPSTDQQLSEWLDGMNCELRDALDVGDMESVIMLSGLISRGAAKMASLVFPSTWCREEGDIVGYARLPCGEASHPGADSHGGPRSTTGLGAAVSVERLGCCRTQPFGMGRRMVSFWCGQTTGGMWHPGLATQYGTCILEGSQPSVKTQRILFIQGHAGWVWCLVVSRSLSWMSAHRTHPWRFPNSIWHSRTQSVWSQSPRMGSLMILQRKTMSCQRVDWKSSATKNRRWRSHSGCQEQWQKGEVLSLWMEWIWLRSSMRGHASWRQSPVSWRVRTGSLWEQL